MSDFDSLLDSAVDAGGLPTEDLLATMLPLMRQVAVVHAAQRVAPLDGTAALRVESGQLWFEDARAEKPRSNIAVIRRLLHPRQSGVDVVEETTLTAGEPEDSDAREALPIGRRGEAITRPVYLPGFSCWELALEHHDPVTDVFSLGMLLAALACGVDLGERAGLESFVVHRRRLFELNDRLHPVIAKAIMEMTELDRHRRPQDVAALVHALENYREQAVDLETAA